MVIPSTLTELIEYGKELQISTSTLTNHIYLSDVNANEIIKIPFNTMIHKYRDFFDKYIITYELTELEVMEYKFQPKKMSSDLYGTTEFWGLLLYINDKHSILDFSLENNQVNIIKPENIDELLNELMIVQKNS